MADAPPANPTTPEEDRVSYLAGRSVPCPRCAYDLRDIPSARCPECAEPLALTIAAPRVRFGWLIVAMVPGSFSGVAAMFLAVPIFFTLWNSYAGSFGVPWPILACEAFGITSAASVFVMYRLRLRLLRWSPRGQSLLALAIWATHIAAFVLFVIAMNYWG